MAVQITNNARSLLAVSISATDPVVRVRVGHGQRFPALSDPDDWFPLAVEDEQGNIEFMKAIGRSGDRIDVLRGQEGTAPRAFQAGSHVQLRLTQTAMEELSGQEVA